LGVDGDLSSEGLSSISPASVQIIRNVQQPITIAAFISKDLPPEFALKAKEVEDKLKAVERSSAGKVELKLYRPANAFDKAGAAAQQHYGVKPFRTQVETVSGREIGEVFLGAAVVSGGRSQVIASFDPGLSVEYELVRAIRTVGSTKKPVLGLAMTDVKIGGDFDFMSGNSRPAWAIVEEWRKQYEVREVNLDSPVADDVAVLVALQPSTLNQAQVEHLHDYIWNGRPALIMEDPLPMFAGPQHAASQPRKPSNPYMQQEQPAPKADLKPLFTALGLEMDSSIVWSNYNPSHQFRNMIPEAVVWCLRDQQSIAAAPVMTGIDSLLLPWPGAIRVSSDKDARLTVTPLIKPTPKARWGRDSFNDYLTPMMGQYMPAQQQPRHFRFENSADVPALAVEVTGTMPSAYPKEDPAAKKDVAAAKPESDKKDDKDKKDEPKPEPKKGVPSPKPIRVIVIADTDLAHDQFDQFRRNLNNQLGKDEFAVLRNLRNIEFIGNAVDALSGDQDFLALRTRRPLSRPLERLDAVLMASEKMLRDTTASAEASAEEEINKARQEFQAKQDKVDSKEDLDENAKAQQKALIAQAEQRKLDARIEEISRIKDDRIRLAKSRRNADIDDNRWLVRMQAVGIPAMVMISLVLAVLLTRTRQERRHIPSSRKRTQP
jgi:ABC-2 type transport system permease protein